VKTIFIFLFCITNLVLQAQQWAWAKSFNLNSNALTPGRNSIAADGSDNLYLSVDLNNSKTCLIKTDPFGYEQWRKYVEGAQNVSRIEVSASGIYMIGTFQNWLAILGDTVVSSGGTDIFFARFDLSGNLQWLKKMGGIKNDKGSGLTIDINGHVYITGMFRDSATFENQTLASECDSKLFIAKYDAQGNKLFLKAGACMMDSTQGSSFSEGRGIKIDAGGNILCSGVFSYFKMDTFQVWGGGGPYNAFFLAKMDASGNTIWAKQVMNGNNVRLEGMTLDNSETSYSPDLIFGPKGGVP
jgi:hypothetical protein